MDELIRRGYDLESKSLPLGGDGMGYIATVQMTAEQAEAVQARLSSHPEGAWEDYLRRANSEE